MSRGRLRLPLLCSLIAFSSLLFPLETAFAQKRKPSKPPVRRPSPTVPTVKKTRLPDVAEVDSGSKGSMLASAARIDELVEANYRKHGVEPNEMTSDEQFLRRVYLDITGTIPTMVQAKAFLRSRASDKRARLIDQLLNSYGYVSHNYNYWGGVLRLQNRPDNNMVADAYLGWVKKSLQENTPYDVWVREMLTAKGKIWENGAAGYILRDDGMPLNHLSNTVRVFLGTQIGCAQCHDHPFDTWTQRQFYELAAYTNGAQTKVNPAYPKYKGKNYYGIISKKIRESSAERPDQQHMLRIVRANRYALYDLPRTLRYPHDYAYDDAQPKAPVRPRFLFGSSSSSVDGDTPREQFANWLTSMNNPRFTHTIVNRLWKRAFGLGQIEPIDDIKDDSVAENPELMDYLVLTMQRVEFDMKEFQRILFNTKAYQRQATPRDLAATETYHFQGPLLRRMSAEQIWDSFLTLAVVDPDQFRAVPVEEISEVINADLTTATLQELEQKGKDFQSLTRGKLKREREKKYTYKGVLLGRASELPVPAPPEHFLRQFGQGDRESIDDVNEDGSVTQVLTMFNGPVTHMLLEEGSTMYNNVVSEDNIDDQIEAIFLTILSRRPTPVEIGITKGEIRKGGRAGYGNVIWALVNTREFLFIQ